MTDTHNYLIYRVDVMGLRDLQAHIELAKVGNDTYQMEIYHSVPNWKFSFEMPYTYTVEIENRYLITLIIEAILNPISAPTGFFATNGTTDSNPEGLEWHEQIMANTSFYGLIRFSEGETRITYYAGNGTYENGITDVHYYLIYRVNGDGLRDVQARIELAKLGDTTYLMEVYHSWKPVYVDMPYEHDVGYYEYKVDYFMKVTIEAIL